MTEKQILQRLIGLFLLATLIFWMLGLVAEGEAIWQWLTSIVDIVDTLSFSATIWLLMRGESNEGE